jgi:hypothetical protein
MQGTINKGNDTLLYLIIAASKQTVYPINNSRKKLIKIQVKIMGAFNIFFFLKNVAMTAIINTIKKI